MGRRREAIPNASPSDSEPLRIQAGTTYFIGMQKRCRATGIDKLVDLIMKAHPSTHNQRGEEACDPFDKLQTLRKNEKKDFETEELIKLIQSAHVTINRLNDRARENATLRRLNLRHARVSDLGKDCAIRTIPGASADILRSWVN